jgi:uncharacterized protein (DUF2062 family)
MKFWVDRLVAALPSRAALAAHPWLKPFAGRLLDPQLWQLQHEAVARGVAVGVFWAFAMPVAQMVVAVVHCIWWRANIPLAISMTLVTNPLTIGPWLWLAYQLGVLLLGETLADSGWQGFAALTWLTEFGLPIMLGMGIFAVGGAAAGYLGIKLALYLQRTLWKTD